MKFRNGFVSNSSTSSFVMIGYNLGEMRYSDLCKQYFPKEFEELKKEVAEKYPNDEDVIEDEAWELVHKLSNANEYASVRSCGYSGAMYIGKILDEGADDGNSMGNVDISLEEVEKIASKVQEELSVDKKPGIITATIGC